MRLMCRDTCAQNRRSPAPGGTPRALPRRGQRRLHPPRRARGAGGGTGRGAGAAGGASTAAIDHAGACTGAHAGGTGAAGVRGLDWEERPCEPGLLAVQVVTRNQVRIYIPGSKLTSQKVIGDTVLIC